MSDTPSAPEAMSPVARILAESNRPVDLTDAKGRRLTVRRLGVLDQARLAKAVGSENSSNAEYMRFVTAAAMVSHVDGIFYPMPKTDAEVDASIGRLGDEGYLPVILQHAKWTRAANALVEDAVRAFEADVKN